MFGLLYKYFYEFQLKLVPSNVWFEMEKACCFLSEVLLSGERSVTCFHISANWENNVELLFRWKVLMFCWSYMNELFSFLCVHAIYFLTILSFERVRELRRNMNYVHFGFSLICRRCAGWIQGSLHCLCCQCCAYCT